MKNKFFTYVVAVIAVIYVIINVLVFTLVDFARLNNPQYWTSWAFMFGVNIVVTALVWLKTRKTEKNDIFVFPVSLIAGGNVVFLALGIIFTAALPKYVYVIVTEVIATLIYALLCFKFVLSVSYIRENSHARDKKISFIRELTALVESYAALAPDDDTSDALKKLAADFRYSDPMSSDKLKEEDDKLKFMAEELGETVKEGNAEDILKAVNRLKNQLKYRNSLCINNK